jgi:N6-adenosine-specific RNA methylase IME4
MTIPTAIIEVTRKTLELGAFRLTATELVVRGAPAFDEWRRCGALLQRIEGAIQWWIGDWLNYGEQQWRDRYGAAADATKIDPGTLRNYAYVAKHVSPSLRSDKVAYSIHKEIAPLAPETQSAILERAEAEDLSVSDVRELIRLAAHADKVAAIARGALPSGEYDIVVADPPWQYDNSGFAQSAAAHYPTLTTDAISALPTTDLTFPKFADPCVLFLWATSPLLPAAHAVLDAWGFGYKACMVWVKDRAPGVGWWLDTRHELILIGVRGSGRPLEKVDSVISAPVDGHSHKPAEAYAAIDRMWPGLRRVECFAREARPGWDRWGNEV